MSEKVLVVGNSKLASELTNLGPTIQVTPPSEFEMKDLQTAWEQRRLPCYTIDMSALAHKMDIPYRRALYKVGVVWHSWHSYSVLAKRRRNPPEEEVFLERADLYKRGRVWGR